MNNVQNQNMKVLEEILAGFNSETVKATLGGLRNFQNGPPPFASSWKAFRHSSVTLTHAVESSQNDLVG